MDDASAADLATAIRENDDEVGSPGGRDPYAVRRLTKGDIGRLLSMPAGMAWKPDRSAWKDYLTDQKAGRRVVLVAVSGSEPVGFGMLSWNSTYRPFRDARVPEINNVVVATAFRRRGVGSAIISVLEYAALEAGRTSVGLGVGVLAEFGAAQRLYGKMGYIADGAGMTRHGLRVRAGSRITVDDDLLIWMAKDLS